MPIARDRSSRWRYDHVILRAVKTAISVPDDTFAAVDAAATKLGISRSQFYARAAQRWVDELEGDALIAQIDASLDDVDQAADAGLVRAAAAKTLARAEW